jgi:hypothetical protein
MRPFRAALALPLLLGASPAPAKEAPRKPEERLVVYREGALATLVNGKFKLTEATWLWLVRMYLGDFNLYRRYNRGITYRCLSEPEKARMDAMGKVDVRRGALYFDGRRIRTNAWRVYRVNAAYYWNGGVVVAANTTKGWYNLSSLFGYPAENEIGFINLRTGRCKFTLVWINIGVGVLPEFVEPVRVDGARRDLELDVEIPERVFLGERLDLKVSLANRSGGAVQVPDSLAGGLGMMRSRTDRDPSDGFWEKLSYAADPEAPSSPLGPGERRESAAPLVVREAFFVNDEHRPGSHRLTFHWDGFLDPSDRGRMSRLFCERLVEVAEPAVDTTNGDLALEIVAAEWVASPRRVKVTFALTNVSGRTIMVPDSLGDGLGVERVDTFVSVPRSHGGHRPGRLEDGVEVTRRETVKHAELGAPCLSPLGPGERREASVTFGSISFGSLTLYVNQLRLDLLCHWDCLMDPDDRGSVTRFVADGGLVEVKGWRRVG